MDNNYLENFISPSKHFALLRIFISKNSPLLVTDLRECSKKSSGKPLNEFINTVALDYALSLVFGKDIFNTDYDQVRATIAEDQQEFLNLVQNRSIELLTSGIESKSNRGIEMRKRMEGLLEGSFIGSEMIQGD